MFSLNIQTLSGQLQALVKEICKTDETDRMWTEHTEKAFELTAGLEGMDSSKQEEQRAHIMLESSAVTLWNHAVAARTKGLLSAAANAQLRNLAFNIVHQCNRNTSDEVTLRKQIMMGLKSGKACLDCDETEKAEQILTEAHKCAEKLQQVIMRKETDCGSVYSGEMEGEKGEVGQDVFKLLCYKAEVAVIQSKFEIAFEIVQSVKEMLPKFPKEGSFLSMLCYNFGVEMFQKKEFKDSVSWLKDSYEIGKRYSSVGSKNQARTLRLMATAYLEWDAAENLQKAFNTVSLANSEHAHPAGLYLKLKIMLLGNESVDRVKAAMHDINNSELSVDLGLHTVNLLTQHKRYELAIENLKYLTQTFVNSPELGKILIRHLETGLEMKQMVLAKDLVVEFITAHNTGRPLDATTRKRFHLIFWDQAALAFDAKHYLEALEWYNHSHSLFSPGEHHGRNVAKLHRNRATCYINVGHIEKANEAISLAEESDPVSPYTQYIVYKLAIMQRQNDRAMVALQKLCDYSSDDQCVLGDISVYSLICLAAQMALEVDDSEVAVTALECLSNKSSDHQQVLTALRCLIRLLLADSDNDKLPPMIKLLQHVKSAHDKLIAISQNGSDIPVNIRDEAAWFMKIAWNLGLQSEDSPHLLKDFFVLCSQLAALSALDLNSLARQKTCLLMAAAACLQLVESTNEKSEKDQLLKEALLHIEGCRNICAKIQVNNFASATTDQQQKDTVEVLLVLYEFESKAKLGDPMLEAVLEKALALPYSEPKTFETIAALAMTSPENQKNISVRAIKIALRKHLQAVSPDFVKISDIGNQAQREEVWAYFSEVIELLEKNGQDKYPEIEIVWLMTKVWNFGIHLYSAEHYTDAERWCALSLKLLKNLSTLRDSYELKMNTIYSDVLAKIENKQLTSELE